VNPEFLMVLPADVERLGGADAAAVLALMRYATEFDDGRHGRLTIDGQVWWRASYADISAATGLTYAAARWHTSKLEKACEVAVLTTFGGDDRTRVYRLSDQPTVVNDIPLTSQLSLATDPPVVNDRPPVVNDRPPVVNDSCSIYMRSREVETKEREGADAPAPPTVESPSVSNPQTANSKQRTAELVLDDELIAPPRKEQRAKTATTRRAKTLLPDGWRPTAEQLNKLAAKYRALDVEYQLDAFLEKAEAHGWTYANWSQAFAVFLRGGGVYVNSRNGNNGSSGHHQKIAAVDAAADRALELLGYGPGNTTTALAGAAPKEIA